MLHKSILACFVVAFFAGFTGCATQQMDDAQYDKWAKKENDRAFEGKANNPNNP